MGRDPPGLKAGSGRNNRREENEMTDKAQGSDRSFTVAGLGGDVTILVDEWGIPHISGGSLEDVIYGQGFNVARERLWQLDYWRRCGLGKLAEAFGPRFAERDRASRLFLYRGDMSPEWMSYATDAKGLVGAFVRGINDYIAQARADETLLPLEFRALGYLPDFWEPSDVTRIRTHGLFYNLRDELGRAFAIRDFGPGLEELRRHREPRRPLVVPEGLDLANLPDDVLKVYDLAVTPPDFTGLDMPRTTGTNSPEGSNNWVIAAGRTATGRPLLANDPHRVMTSFPSMRYLVQLTAPGFDAIGGSEIGLPGIFTGHNETSAFGITFNAVDQEDLYCYELHPEHDDRYLYEGDWLAMRTEHEEIAVAGEATRPATLQFTRHGPVIHVDTKRRRAYALRAAWLEPGMAPYLGSLSTMRARSWNEFFWASNRWKAPGANLIYADINGDIGWKLSGLVPRREGWDGTLPVPGDGRYEWQGFYDGDELPFEHNPGRGWIATANEMNIPADYPADRHLGYEWFSRLRKDRITEVMDGAADHSVEGSNALQNDVTNLLARHVLAHVGGLGLDPAPAALQRLLDWDHRMDARSAEAALFEVWWRDHFHPALMRRAVEQVVSADRVDAALRCLTLYELVPDARVPLDILDNRQRLGPDHDAWLRQTVQTTLAAASADLAGRLGDDPAQQAWGRLHQAWMVHPARALLTGKLPENLLVTETVPRGGSGDTVGLTAYDANYRQIVGSTLRLVSDVGNWDASVAMNAPGQSGRLDDRFCGNLLHPWANGESVPLCYSAAKVAQHKSYEIVLKAEKPGRTR